MNKLLILFALAPLILSTGCSSGLFSVHKLQIQQGNALNEEDVVRIQPGMSRKDVESILRSSRPTAGIMSTI
jgi:outer membrane protein assembly factor BamE